MLIYDPLFIQNLSLDSIGSDEFKKIIIEEKIKYNIYNLNIIDDEKTKKLFEANSALLSINLLIIINLSYEKLYHAQLIIIARLIKIYPFLLELKNFESEIRNKYCQYFKFDNDFKSHLKLLKTKNEIILKKYSKIKINNINDIQKKYEEAKKNSNDELKIVLSIIAIEKFGETFLSQLCTIFLESNKVNEALQVLLFLTYRDPLSIDVISKWGKISIDLVSKKNYWIAKIGSELFPNDTNILVNLAALCAGPNSYSEAKNNLVRALQINPLFYPAMMNLANLLASEGETSQALQMLEKAKKIENSKFSKIDSNILFISQYEYNLNYTHLFEKHIEFSKNITILKKNSNKLVYKPKTNNKIKIGLVSSDLINHPVSYYMFKFVKYLNKDEFDIYIYNLFQRKDSVTKSFMDLVGDKWRDVAIYNDLYLHDLIVNDGIDILFDLNGHTAGGRMQLFATRSANIQISYVGYPFSTGLTNMDYRLTDYAYEDDQQYCSEKLKYIKDSLCCYQPLVARMNLINSDIYQVQQTPCMKNGYITFGLTTNSNKLNYKVIETFSKILLKVKRSKLLIEANGFNDNSFKQIFIEKFKNNGIDETRLDLRQRDSSLQYIIYNLIDIALDPFPYGGGTSTLDLLWMGIPLITLKGKVAMSREGAACLIKINDLDGIATNIDDYIQKAIIAADDIQKINRKRLMQREIFNQSALMDGERFGINLGNGLKELMNK
jgi:predicted O-linked N-acetylglucosamine transferase (SPINDLY family)